ncbi:hypothetical protein [Chitinophaga arvensicola]|uniref:Outer membrane protein beta-barrel domain-containing protein n=1 Tax=Chitinophaga arvensicola TaxID=29529 RepID=A0A1I0SDW2_9BACT|nr:hypothetical protein [Chitinophaga arvensicola]SEW56399.1 hypothetical protein SAMN04488122_6654 [Chitinophaga arvensicola]
MRLIFICISLLITTCVHAQDTLPFLEIKPAIGVTWITVKPTVSVMAFHQFTPKFSIASHSMLSFLLFRNFPQEYIKTNYNYALTQKLGIGYSLYGPKGKTRHTILIMGGIKYTAFSETLDNPELEKITTATHRITPDYGLMYDLSLGTKKRTFDARLYFPFYPIRYYPLGTVSNIGYLELGLGFKLNRRR